MEIRYYKRVIKVFYLSKPTCPHGRRELENSLASHIASLGQLQIVQTRTVG